MIGSFGTVERTMEKIKFDVEVWQDKADTPTWVRARTLKGLWFLRKYIPRARRLARYQLTIYPDTFIKGAGELKIGGRTSGSKTFMWINPRLH